MSVPATNHKRRDSTNGRITYGTNRLRIIGKYGINIRMEFSQPPRPTGTPPIPAGRGRKLPYSTENYIFSTPQSRLARRLPYIAPQHRGANGCYFCPCGASPLTNTLQFLVHIGPKYTRFCLKCHKNAIRLLNLTKFSNRGGVIWSFYI